MRYFFDATVGWLCLFLLCLIPVVIIAVNCL